MTIKFVKIGLLAFLATTLTFTSCKKSDDAQPNATQEQQAVESASYSERTFESTMDIGEQSMDATGMQARPSANGGLELETEPFPSGGSCATITQILTPAGSTLNTATGRQVTIDFTPQGCLGGDGRTRKGKIFINFQRPSSATGNQNPFNVIDRVVYITFGTGNDAHFVDGVRVEGVHKTTVLANTFIPTSTANISLGLTRVHRIEVGGINTNGVISGSARLTFPDNTTHEWNADRTRRVSATIENSSVAGFVPNIVRQSIQVRVWGVQNGKTRQNNTYSAVTADTDAERLWFKMCNLAAAGTTALPRLTPVQGKITISGSNRPVVVLDYGTGTCDNQYTATALGQTFNLTF
ncbi:MAG: hypothetical protein EAZ06_05390 [Cytophagales bacterium]|nr:MAG: hypothetical protein EAZ06_05390 [Cytophagales bacterium]